MELVILKFLSYVLLQKKTDVIEQLILFNDEFPLKVVTRFNGHVTIVSCESVSLTSCLLKNGLAPDRYRWYWAVASATNAPGSPAVMTSVVEPLISLPIVNWTSTYSEKKHVRQCTGRKCSRQRVHKADIFEEV